MTPNRKSQGITSINKKFHDKDFYVIKSLEQLLSNASRNKNHSESFGNMQVFKFYYWML